MGALRSQAPFSSSLRFAPELIDECLPKLGELGDLRWISGITVKTWERYGIHMLEPLMRIVGPGFDSIRMESQPGLQSPTSFTAAAYNSPCRSSMTSPRSAGSRFAAPPDRPALRFASTYTNFRRLMLSFIGYVQYRHTLPFPSAKQSNSWPSSSPACAAGPKTPGASKYQKSSSHFIHESSNQPSQKAAQRGSLFPILKINLADPRGHRDRRPLRSRRRLAVHGTRAQ